MPIPFVRGYPDPDAPDGIKRALHTITRSGEIQAIADRFIVCGGRYLCEIARGGDAHLMAVIDVAGKAAKIADERTANGPELLDAVDRLIKASGRHLDSGFAEVA